MIFWLGFFKASYVPCAVGGAYSNFGNKWAVCKAFFMLPPQGVHPALCLKLLVLFDPCWRIVP